MRKLASDIARQYGLKTIDVARLVPKVPSNHRPRMVRVAGAE